ncbi:MAG: mechanosensitive ion channel [Dehalococcoidales bacterium]|nr:mechanosensitive ion channel [Dehalococcoidales bacterium]
MWQWFTANGIWILVASGIGVIVLLFIRQRVQGRTEKITQKERRKTLERSMRLTVWITGGILLVIIALALTAIIISREGVSSVITTETIQKWFLEHGVLILVIILVSYLVYRLLKVVIPEIVERSIRMRGKGRRAREELAKRAQTLSSILAQIAGILILIVALFMILSEVGIDITPLLAGAGVAGIAIGFGAQSLIRDVLNGLFILLEDQYNKGDVVKIAGIWGLVEEVNLRRTVMRDLDGAVHSIPNGEIKTVSNFTRDWSRVNLNISVAYGTDLDHAISVINRVGKELAADEQWGKMIKTPPQVLRVDNLGDSGIELKILGDVQPIKQWDIMGQLRLRIKKAFDAEGIEIPWPHVKLYFGQSQVENNLTCKACSHANLPGSKFCSNCGASLGS